MPAPTPARTRVTRARDVRASLDIATIPGHTAGMTSTEKIAISLPKRVAQQARRAVRDGRAASVSAYIAAAIEERATLDELAILLDEMLVESGGPLTPAEKRAADRALGVSSTKRRRSR